MHWKFYLNTHMTVILIPDMFHHIIVMNIDWVFKDVLMKSIKFCSCLPNKTTFSKEETCFFYCFTYIYNLPQCLEKYNHTGRWNICQEMTTIKSIPKNQLLAFAMKVLKKINVKLIHNSFFKQWRKISNFTQAADDNHVNCKIFCSIIENQSN